MGQVANATDFGGFGGLPLALRSLAEEKERKKKKKK
jgi:hypothetical protein